MILPWRHKDFDSVSVPGVGQFGFQLLGAADAALRVIDKTKQDAGLTASGMEGGVRRDPFGKFLRRQTRASFLRYDGDVLAVQQERGKRRVSRVGRSPFFDPHVVEFHFEKGPQQVLHVKVILDLDRRASVIAEAQLASDRVESQADFADKPERVAFGIRHGQRGERGDRGRAADIRIR